jgi:hypothetical protein
MLQLTKLEQAVLKEICRQQILMRQSLETQLATATVIRRENSGAGFFTCLAVDRSTAAVSSDKRVLGYVAATVEGFRQPILLLLFMKDGYTDFIEGATVGESTVDIDLSTLRFRIDARHF